MSYVIPVSDHITELEYRKVYAYFVFHNSEITHSGVIQELIKRSGIKELSDNLDKQLEIIKRA